MSAAGRFAAGAAAAGVPGGTADATETADARDAGEADAGEHPPRPVIRADLRGALGVLVAMALAGAPLGVLWSLLAPPEIVAVLADPAAGDGGVLPFTGQSEHRFDGLALFVLLGMATGVLAGAVLWRLRHRRGPVVLVAGVLGSLAAGWIAMRIGLSLAGWQYAAPAVTQPGDALRRAPVLESSWALVAQPFGVAVAYSFAVAWNGTPDLDRPEPR